MGVITDLEDKQEAAATGAAIDEVKRKKKRRKREISANVLSGVERKHDVIYKSRTYEDELDGFWLSDLLSDSNKVVNSISKQGKLSYTRFTTLHQYNV